MLIRISAALADEYVGRLVFPFAQREGMINATLEQARELLEDARFNADRRYGPEEMPAGKRRAYAALEERLAMAFDAAKPYEPPAYLQSETSRGEPREHYPELRIEEVGRAAPDLFAIVPDEREVRSLPAVRRQVARFNNTIGLFAALQLWNPRVA